MSATDDLCRQKGDPAYSWEPPVEVRLEALSKSNKRLREALEKARDKFREYQKLHLAKNTPDGTRKAQANRAMAEMCDAALKDHEPGGGEWPERDDDLAWLGRVLKDRLPTGHCGESTDEVIHRQRLEDRVDRILAALKDHGHG